MDQEDRDNTRKITDASVLYHQICNDLKPLRWNKWVSVLALVMVAITFTYIAYMAEYGSFLQTFTAETTAALLLFMSVQPVLTLMRHGWRLWLLALVLCAGFFAAAWHTSGVTRSLCMEGAIGTLLLLLLDLQIHNALVAIARNEQEGRKKMHEAMDKIRSIEDYQDDKYYWCEIFGIPRPDHLRGPDFSNQDDPMPVGHGWLAYSASNDRSKPDPIQP